MTQDSLATGGSRPREAFDWSYDMLIRNRTMLPAIVLVLGAWVTGCGSSDAIVEPPIEWFTVWSDEFDGEAGQSPSTERWAFDIGTGQGGWGNNQLEYDTNLPRNVSMDGEGSLAITAIREDFGGAGYTSARIKTQGLYTQKYGRIEARIQLPVGQGLWPAFWMLGDNIEDVGWPQTGEIDIMEYRGQEPNIVHGSLHGPGYSGGSPVTSRFRLSDGAIFPDNFHVFAVEWDPGQVSWFVDGERFNTVTSPEVRGRGQWVYDHPFFLILNLAVGGAFLGNPDASTVFPQTMRVDYVRVLSRQRP